jgi:hypothetical protein
MADQDAIICIGSSNMAGFLANLYDVDADSYIRWFSESVPTALSPTRPYEKSVGGVRLWTPRRPYSVNAQRLVTNVVSTTITYGGAVISPTPTEDQWVFVLRGSGRGNIQRITVVAGQDITVASALSPAVVNGDTLVVLLDSHTMASLDATGTVITKVASTSPDFTAAAVGRYVAFLTVGAGGFNMFNDTRRIVDWTADTLTVDMPFNSPQPGAGAGFCVLSGANACEGYSSMQPPNAVLRDLTVYLDEIAPVNLTGFEYYNGDFTPFPSPRRLSADPTINSIPELAWQVKSKTNDSLVCLQVGVSASMVSSFPLKPVSAAAPLVGPLNEFRHLDWHPTSPLGIYEILINSITSMRSLIQAEGNTMKVRGIFINLFDNDAQDTQRVSRIGANTVLLRDSIRTFLGDQRIPWIMSGPSAYGGGPGNANNTEVYRQIYAISEADTYSGVVDTRVGYTYAEDNAHLSAAAQVKLGQDYFRVWEPIYDLLFGPTPSGELIEIAICNRALSAIGEAPSITSLRPPEGSVNASKCALLLDQAVNLVATSRHWTHADKRVVLQKMQINPINNANTTSDTITTATPHGLRNGCPLSVKVVSGVLPTPLQENAIYYAANVGATTFQLASQPGGAVIDLTAPGIGWTIYKESDRSAYRYMYALPADCMIERAIVPEGAPDDWRGMDGSSLGRTELGSGFVNATVNGFNHALDVRGFGERQPIPWKRALNVAGERVIYTDLDAAELVYTANVTDATQWPPEWQQAVEFMLTAYLFGSVKKDPKAEIEYMNMAQYAISEAGRTDAQRVTPARPRSYPWAR